MKQRCHFFAYIFDGTSQRYNTSGMMKYVAFTRSKKNPTRKIPAKLSNENPTSSKAFTINASLVINEIDVKRKTSIRTSLYLLENSFLMISVFYIPDCECKINFPMVFEFHCEIMNS